MLDIFLLVTFKYFLNFESESYKLILKKDVVTKSQKLYKYVYVEIL